MALVIKTIPTLTGEDARRFVEQASKAYKKRATVDFSKQFKVATAILQKAKMKL